MFIVTLAIEHNPEAGSLCPRLDLIDPIFKGSDRPVQKISSMANNSSGSPTLVPAEGKFTIKKITTRARMEILIIPILLTHLHKVVD